MKIKNTNLHQTKRGVVKRNPARKKHNWVDIAIKELGQKLNTKIIIDENFHSGSKVFVGLTDGKKSWEVHKNKDFAEKRASDLISSDVMAYVDEFDDFLTDEQFKALKEEEDFSFDVDKVSRQIVEAEGSAKFLNTYDGYTEIRLSSGAVAYQV